LARPEAPPSARWVILRRVGSAVLRSSWLWGAVVLVLSWRLAIAGPQQGLDPSWQTGLRLAAHEHLRFGRQIIYTYGPLGFLSYPMLAYVGLARLSYVYDLVVNLALAVTLVWGLRRSFGSIWLAVPLALLALAVLTDAVVGLVAIGALGALQAPPSPRRTSLLLVVAGMIAGLETLVKFNTGTTVAAISLIAILALPDRRRWGMTAFVGSFALSTLVFWLLAGQQFGDLWAFFHTVLSVVSGYSQTLGLEQPERQWEYYAAALLVILGVVAAFRSGRAHEQPRRAGLVIVWLVLSYLEFKEGFVRHDEHSIQFFATLLVAFIGFRWASGWRTSGALLWMTFLFAYFGVTHADPGQMVHPVASTKLFFQDAGLMTNGSEIDGDIVKSRNALIAAYKLDTTTCDLVRGHSVAITPWEDSLAWAYSLYWLPPPEFQAFTAYTTLLDDANASTLARSTGPDRVLSQPPQSLDGRFPGFDAPAATRTLLCHFVPVSTTSAWEVLARVPDRCGIAQHLVSVRAADGQAVPVPTPPQPDEQIFVRIAGIQVSGLEQIRTLLFRSLPRYVTLNSAARFRLVSGTAGDGLLLSAPANADYPGAYRLAPDAKTIAVGVFDSTDSSKRLTFSFYAESIRPLPSSGP